MPLTTKVSEDIQEKIAFHINGFAAVLLIVGLAVFGFKFSMAISMSSGVEFVFFTTGLLLFMAVGSGFVVIPPNEARVLTFFGTYVGSVKKSGFFLTVPLTVKAPVSLKVSNFSSGKLKVNDATGNPIEIAAVVVWKVSDSAKAHFSVDNYAQFVATQSETAIRTLASRYPYDAVGSKKSLRGSTDEVNKALQQELQERLAVAGIALLDTRLSHLAYAPEIAGAMLRRQQAEAVVSARKHIVENAVNMVDAVVQHLEKKMGADTLDNDKKLALINNLLVALVSEQDAQPVINMSG